MNESKVKIFSCKWLDYSRFGSNYYLQSFFQLSSFTLILFVPGELLGLLEEGGCEAGEGDLLPPAWGGGGLPGEGSM